MKLKIGKNPSSSLLQSFVSSLSLSIMKVLIAFNFCFIFWMLKPSKLPRCWGMAKVDCNWMSEWEKVLSKYYLCSVSENRDVQWLRAGISTRYWVLLILVWTSPLVLQSLNTYINDYFTFSIFCTASRACVSRNRRRVCRRAPG